MFVCSRPFLFFDYFRIPHRVAEREGLDDRVWPAGIASARAPGGGKLVWPDPESRLSEGAAVGRYSLGSAVLPSRVLRDETVVPLLSAAGGEWSRATPITDRRGTAISSLWRERDGSVFLPFDPAEAIRSLWSEAYLDYERSAAAARLLEAARWTYYRARRAFPRSVLIHLRRAFSRLQARASFPGWPIETCLHDLYERLFALTAEVAREPVPWIGPWPNGHDWALVLTHDVETKAGYELLGTLRELEVAAGFRSSWNFVPRRYEVADDTVRELQGSGFEVGVHGLHHDGRDLESLETLQERLSEIRAFAKRWSAVGFRSPATQRRFELMPLLGFDYDSSYPDTDPYEPQSGGCCTWLPFFNRDTVELPITLPQDHTLFVILNARDERSWVEKAEFLRSQGGMALLITHPDYQLDGLLVRAYAAFLARFADDSGVWRALPREVSAWWRRRSASHLVDGNGAWRIEGPAASEGAILFAKPGRAGQAAYR